jgi:hypothetical protein
MTHVSSKKKPVPFTPMYNGVSVGHGGGPKEPLPIHLTDELLYTCVTPIDSCVNILQDDLSFFWLYAFH